MARTEIFKVCTEINMYDSLKKIIIQKNQNKERWYKMLYPAIFKPKIFKLKLVAFNKALICFN